MNVNVSEGKNEACPRLNEKLRLDVMSSSLEVGSTPVNSLSAGCCCGGPSLWLLALAELCISWRCVTTKGQVSWPWQQLRAFARNKPISKGRR